MLGSFSCGFHWLVGIRGCEILVFLPIVVGTVFAYTNYVMVYQDDRTAEQLKTHQYLITATDRFMSGWGEARGGLSKCAWACETAEEAAHVIKWVCRRGDMKYVKLRRPWDRDWRPSAAHVHVYVVDKNHPALPRAESIA